MLNVEKNTISFKDVDGEGIIDKVVRQGHKWRVQVHGVYWFARSVKPAAFVPGDCVRIVGRQNTTLLVDAA